MILEAQPNKRLHPTAAWVHTAAAGEPRTLIWLSPVKSATLSPSSPS